MSDCVTLSCQFNVVVLESHFPRFACSHSALHTDYHDTLCGLDALRFAGISIHCFCALFVITGIAAMHAYAVHFPFSRVWGAILSSCFQVFGIRFGGGFARKVLFGARRRLLLLALVGACRMEVLFLLRAQRARGSRISGSWGHQCCKHAAHFRKVLPPMGVASDISLFSGGCQGARPHEGGSQVPGRVLLGQMGGAPRSKGGCSPGLGAGVLPRVGSGGAPKKGAPRAAPRKGPRNEPATVAVLDCY